MGDSREKYVGEAIKLVRASPKTIHPNQQHAVVKEGQNFGWRDDMAVSQLAAKNREMETDNKVRPLAGISKR